MRYIRDLKNGDHVIEHYFCKEKQMMLTKAGKSYINLTLQDQTGTMNAKIWDLTPQIQDFKKGQIIKVDCRINLYQEELQATIYRLRPSAEGEYMLSDYIPRTKKDVEKLYQGILKRIREVRNPYMHKLLVSFFIDDADLIRRFKEHPAAKSVHHQYLGGLIEHTCGVVDTAAFLAEAYGADKELVITAALLHDIGKLEELSPLPVTEYTDEGQMIGHIMLGYSMVRERIAQIPDFPADLENQLLHVILSHHGELEFGSPKVPMTQEAMIVHYADNIDAKMKVMETAICEDHGEGHFTQFNRFLNRPLYKPQES